MKYIAITFDDGREDNYSVAFPILKNKGYNATVYCTTGFIDETWQKKNDWYSAENHLSIEQLKELKEAGWEIALHGDKHITEISDTKNAIEKIKTWGLFKGRIGHSLPDSASCADELEKVLKELYPETISYIRFGRGISTKSFKNRLLFACYTYLHLQWAYNCFNKKSVNYINDLNPKKLYSVVIRKNDNPKMISKFIDKLPDGAFVVLMFHSIHKDQNLYENDPWNWSETNFSSFCDNMSKLKNISVVTVEKIMEGMK